jgi:hypothetical protein
MRNIDLTITSDKLLQGRTFLLTAFLLFIAAPYSFYYDPGVGLDPGWMYAINMAVQKRISFGDDFLFTYGPLGFLAVRLPVLLPRSLYLLFDLYVLLNIGYVFYTILKKNNEITTFVFIFLVLVLMQDFRDHDIVMVLTWLLLFMLAHYYQERKNLVLYNGAFLSIIITFIKLNMGIIGLFIFLLYLVFLLISKTHTLKYLAYFALGYCIVLTLACFLLNVNFFAYVVGSLHIINGYNDAMYAELPNPLSNSVFLSAVFLATLFIGFLLYYTRTIIHNTFYLFISTVVLLMIYVQFKQGFVRLHAESYFQYFTPYLALLFLFTAGEIKRTMRSVLLASLFVCYITQGNGSLLFSHSLVRDRMTNIKTYFTQFISYNDVPPVKEEQKMPKPLLEEIKGSVDIIPYDIASLYYNHLSYNPRPVIQTYTAYDAYLDEKNAKKYNSTDAPENLLIQYHAIDNRYPLFDETKTKLAILRNYEVANYTWNHSLLKRLDSPLTMDTEKFVERKGKLGEYIKIDDTQDLQCFYADIRYSLLGKLRRLLFQPPALLVTVTTENGVQYTYRAITTILQGGVIINRHIKQDMGQEELDMFITFNGELNDRITNVKIHTDDSWGFDEDYNFYFEKVKFEKRDKAKAIFQPLPFEVLSPTNNLQVNVENIKNTRAFAMIYGWAFPAGKTVADRKTYVVLQSPTRSYVFPTQVVLRRDVSAYFKDSLDASGFKALIFNQFVDDGEYKVGILIKGESDSFLQFSDKRVTFSRDKPPVVPRESWVEGGAKYFIENFAETNTSIDMGGWAFSETEQNDSLNISLVLESAFQLKIIPLEKVIRADVSAYFKRNDLNNSGFTAVISKNSLPTGVFKIALLIETPTKKRIVHTDKMISVLR